MARNLSFGVSRGPHSSTPRFFVTVLPPLDFMTKTSASGSNAFASGSHLRRGALMPLYPTLGAQLYAISRENGLPSIGGLTLYLADDGDGNPGPRISEDTWPFLWGRYFDTGAEDLYQDMTNPSPSLAGPYSSDPSMPSFPSDRFGRASSSTSGDGMHDSADAGGPSDSSSSLPFHPHQRGFTIASTFAGHNGHRASPTRFATPSPLRRDRQDAARSASAMSGRLGAAAAMGRLPIVARIEWAVDTSRAPWWNQWLSQKEQMCSNGGSRVPTTPSADAAVTRDFGPQRHKLGRRSMHLPQLRGVPTPRAAATPSSSRSPSSASLHSNDAGGATTSAPAPPSTTAQSHRWSRRDSKTGSSQHIAGDDVRPHNAAQEADLRFSAFSGSRSQSRGDATNDDDTLTREFSPQHRRLRSIRDSYDDATQTQGEERSYAGYSVLMDDAEPAGYNENESKDGESQMTRQRETLPLSVKSGTQTGSGKGVETNVMMDTDGVEGDRDWVRPDASNMTVREWISKTAPPTAQKPPFDAADEDIMAEEDLLPPEDDVSAVLGLWKEKIRSHEGAPHLDPYTVGDSHNADHAQLADDEPAATSSARYSTVSVEDATASKRASRATMNSRTRSARTKHGSTLEGSNNSSPASTRLVNLARPAESSRSADVSNSHLQPTRSLVPSNVLASLRSPIALQEDFASFDGPPSRLGTFIEGTDPTQVVEQRASEGDRSSPSILQTSSAPDEKVVADNDDEKLQGRTAPTHLAPTPRDGLGMVASSPQLQLPMPQSPNSRSGSSSASDVSDALMDMERALALLSPVASPALQEAVIDSGAFSRKRSRNLKALGISPRLSASENMERARHLSASVAPSPHWFHSRSSAGFPAQSEGASLTSAMQAVAGPKMRRSTIGSESSNVGLPAGEQGEAALKASPRPKSISAMNAASAAAGGGTKSHARSQSRISEKNMLSAAAVSQQLAELVRAHEPVPVQESAADDASTANPADEDTAQSGELSARTASERHSLASRGSKDGHVSAGSTLSWSAHSGSNVSETHAAREHRKSTSSRNSASLSDTGSHPRGGDDEGAPPPASAPVVAGILQGVTENGIAPSARDATRSQSPIDSGILDLGKEATDSSHVQPASYHAMFEKSSPTETHEAEYDHHVQPSSYNAMFEDGSYGDDKIGREAEAKTEEPSARGVQSPDLSERELMPPNRSADADRFSANQGTEGKDKEDDDVLSTTMDTSKHEAQGIHSSLSGAMPRYATVGVQAEAAPSVRDSSRYSLVSGDASTMSERSFADEDDVSDQPDFIELVADQTEEANASDAERLLYSTDYEAETNKAALGDSEAHTPVAPYVEQFGPRNGTEEMAAGSSTLTAPHAQPSRLNEDTMHHAFERFIRGDSFVDSLSSSAESSLLPSPQPQRMQLHMYSPGDDFKSTEVHENQQATTRSRTRSIAGTTDASSSPAESNEPATAAQSEAYAQRASKAISLDAWSDDESAPGLRQSDAFASTVGDLDEAASLGSYARESHLFRIPRTSDSGEIASGEGLTPTFFYDSHLAGGDETGFKRESRQQQQQHRISLASEPRHASKLSPADGLSRASSLAQTRHSMDTRGLGLESTSISFNEDLQSGDTTMSRHEVMSMAGEEMLFDGQHMPDGFEEVEVHSTTESSRSPSNPGGRSSQDA